MKVSYLWLKDYVDLRVKPKELAERLTMAGLEVISLQQYGDDSVFEIEPTPNRPDCLSIVGLAREVSAITGSRFKAMDKLGGCRKPKTPPKARLAKGGEKRQPSSFNIIVVDKNACPLYIGRLIKDVKVGPSPSWLKGRLENFGLRSINNIVDITNYVCLEMGQPLHAFDYEKIDGKRIVVRRAKQGERIITINNVEHILDESVLLISDAEKPLAIAGIMGGKDSEVTKNTKHILLESACFNPLLVRRAARGLKTSTESSYRFERGIDLYIVGIASKRAASLILQLAGGKLMCAKTCGVNPEGRKSPTIILRPERVNRILGANISIATAKDALKGLGFKPIIHKPSDNTLKISVPSFRRDIKEEIDLIEELARVYGYERMPAKLPSICFGFIPPEKLQTISRLTRHTLTGLGFNEAITYSLISPRTASFFGYEALKMLKLVNPLSLEQELLRPSILPGLVNAVAYNINRQIEEPKLFELGRVFSRNGSGIKENTHLAIAIAGNDFFYIKGVMQTLFDTLCISDYCVEEGGRPYLSSGMCAIIKMQNKDMGDIGQLSKRVLEAMDLKKALYVCEICINDIMPLVKLERHFLKIPRYPAQFRDISIEIDENMPYERISCLIKDAGSPLVKDARLIDYYKGTQLKTGKKSLTYSLEYRSDERTLTDDEVSEVHIRICQRVTSEFNARIR